MNKLNENIFHQYNKWKSGYVRKETVIEKRIKEMTEWVKEKFATREYNINDFEIDGIEGISYDGSFGLMIDDNMLVDGKLPYPFNKVSTPFIFYYCKTLLSLENTPRFARGISIQNCPKITSLKGGPEYTEIVSIRKCDSLTSLEGAPVKMHPNGTFSIRDCVKLKSLKGISVIGRSFECNGCISLTSLKGLPDKIDGYLECDRCDSLKNLVGCPKEVGGHFDCQNCANLTSLKGAPEIIGTRCWLCNNHQLKSLKYTPSVIGGELLIPKQFTENDVPDYVDADLIRVFKG